MKSKEAKQRSIFLTLGIVIVLFNGCMIYTNISATARTGVDFSKYHSFNWYRGQIDTCDAFCNNDSIEGKVRSDFARSFRQRGYTLNDTTPDIFLIMRICNKKRKIPDAYSPAPWASYHAVLLYPPVYSHAENNYLESTIILKAFDRKLNKLVWSGSAQGDIYDFGCTNQNMTQAVETIMQKYPTKPSKSIGK